MASGYNLTVQLNLQGPKNVGQIVNNINKQLGNIQANVNIKTSSQAQKAMQGIANSAKQVSSQSQQAATGMEKFGKQAGLAVKRFGAFTAATAVFYGVTRATTQAIDKFIEYDRQLIRVAQVTNTAKDGLSDLDQTITKLSTSLGTSSSELAQISVTLSQAGLSAQETAQALQALALTDLAPTFTNLNNTVEGSIALMKQFSIGTGELEGALGSINAVAGQFAVEAGDIITAIQRTGGVFAAASNGVSQGTDALNEFIAVFTSVRATTRESAETIATGLRTIFTRVQREDTLDALKDFGIELTDLEGKFVGPYKAIELLAQGLRNLDPRDVKFSSLVEELGGFRQVGKVIPLIQQFATAQSALSAAQAGAGSLAKDAALGQQALAVQIAKVGEEFNALIRSVGQDQGMQDLLSLTLDVASAMITVADSVKGLIPLLTTLGAIKVFAGIPGLAKGFKAGIGGGKGYATGGYVTGPGGIDKVRAKLTQGEYVIRQKSVQSLGRDTLEEINRTGEMPRYAKGGPVAAETFASSAVRKKVVRPKGTPKDYQAGNLINYNDQFQFGVTEIPVDASPKIGNTMFEKRVAATVQGRWQGKNKAVDVLGSGGEPIEVRNRGELTDAPTLGDKLARHYITDLRNSAVLKNTGKGNESINLGNIKVAYNTGKLNEETKAGLGKSQKLAKLPKGAKNAGFDFTPRAKGGNIGPEEQNALLTSGEYVLSKDAAKRLGRNNLDSLNQADRQDLPRYHTGGAVGHIPRYNTGGGVGGGGILLTSLAIQGLTSAISTSIEDASSRGAAEFGAAISGLGGGVSQGLITGQIASLIPGLTKYAGAIGAVAGVALGVSKAFIDVQNASKLFAEKISKQNIDSALEKVSVGFEKVAEEATKLEGLGDVVDGIVAATKEISESRSRESGTGTLQFSNLPEYLFGLGQSDRTQEQVDAGTNKETISAQRALVLELRGISAYFSTLNLFGDNDSANENLSSQISEINEQRSRDSSKQFKGVADSAIRIIEQRLNDGISLQDIIDSDSFDQMAESLARANPVIEKLILGIQANTEMTNQEKEARIRRIVEEEAFAATIAQTAGVRQKIEMDAASKMGKNISTTLSRVFDSFEQIFNAAGSSIDASFEKIQLDAGAFTGKASIGLGEDKTKVILENPRSFSSEEFTGAVNSLKPILGKQGETIGNLAIAGRDLEGQILSSINTRMQENPEANGSRLARLVGKDIKAIIGNLKLPPEIADTLTAQISAGIEGLRSQGKDKVDIDSSTVRENVSGFAETIDAISGSTQVLIQAQELYRTALERYTQISNQIITTLETRNNLVNNSFSILERGAMQLSQAFGAVFTAADARSQQNVSIGRQTGGLTDPSKIFQKMILLSSRQRVLQDNRNDNQSPAKFDTFKNFDDELINVNVQMNALEQALQSLANSSSVADAALADIAKKNQERQQQAGFIGSLVSSTPEQLRGLNQAYADMQRALNGQISTIQTSQAAQQAYVETLSRTGNRRLAGEAAQGQLAQERGAVQSLLKEILPFLGNDSTGNNMRADILNTQLRSIGQLTPQFTKVLSAIRDPAEDPAQAASIRAFKEATQKQSDANGILGELQAIAAQNLSENSAAAIADAIHSTIQQVRVINFTDFRSSAQPPPTFAQGGPVGVTYAQQGTHVAMQPKGTDTVPAMLTPGEFVVNRKATQQNRGLLESINSGKPNYYNLGGLVSDKLREPAKTISKSIPDQQLWEDIQRGPQSTKLASYKEFTNFNTQGVKPQYIKEMLPQDFNPNNGSPKTITDTEQLLREVVRPLQAPGSKQPGVVPPLNIERLGKYGAPNSKEFIDFGVATKIAQGAKFWQSQQIGYNKQNPPTPIKVADITSAMYPAISKNSGVDIRTIKSYLARDAAIDQSGHTQGDYDTTGGAASDNKSYSPDRIQPYLGPTPVQKTLNLDPKKLGLYSLLYPLPSTTNYGQTQPADVTGKKFEEYQKSFRTATNSTFGKKPQISDRINDNLPSAIDPNNPFMFKATGTEYHGLYNRPLAESLQTGPKIEATSTLGSGFGAGFNIGNGGTSGRIEATSRAPYSSTRIQEDSENLYKSFTNTKSVLSGGLKRNQNAETFEETIKQLVGNRIDDASVVPEFMENIRKPWDTIYSKALSSKYKNAIVTKQTDGKKPEKISIAKTMESLSVGTKGGPIHQLSLGDNTTKDLIEKYKKQEMDKGTDAKKKARVNLAGSTEAPKDRAVDNRNEMWLRYNSAVRFLKREGIPAISENLPQIPRQGEKDASFLIGSAKQIGGDLFENGKEFAQGNSIVTSVFSGYKKVFQNLGTGLIEPFLKPYGVDTKKAALSFAQVDWMRNYPSAALPNGFAYNIAEGFSPAVIEKAASISGKQGMGLETGSFGTLLDGVINPYQRYSDRDTRSKAITELFHTLAGNGYYGNQRNSFGVPSVGTASRGYSSLKSWYSGGARWPGQDGFSEGVGKGTDSIEKAKEWLGMWPTPQAAPTSWGDNPLKILGFGAYGKVPNIKQIAGIEGLDYDSIYNNQAQFMSQGGRVAVQRAIDEVPLPSSNIKNSNPQMLSTQNNRQVNKDLKNVSPVTGKKIEMDSPLLDGLMAGGLDFGSSILDLLGVIPGAVVSAVSLPGAAVEQTGIGDFIGDKVGDFIYPEVASKGVTPSEKTSVTSVMKGGLSSFTKPGSKIAENMFGKENMTSDSYIAGASQEEYMANLFKTDPAAALAMMGIDLASPDGTEAIRFASLLTTAFPTVAKMGNTALEGAKHRKLLKVDYGDIGADINKIKATRKERSPGWFGSNPYTKEELAQLEKLERQKAILQNELYSPNPAARSDPDAVAKVIADRKAEKEALEAAAKKATTATNTGDEAVGTMTINVKEDTRPAPLTNPKGARPEGRGVPGRVEIQDSYYGIGPVDDTQKLGTSKAPKTEEGGQTRQLEESLRASSTTASDT